MKAKKAQEAVYPGHGHRGRPLIFSLLLLKRSSDIVTISLDTNSRSERDIRYFDAHALHIYKPHLLSQCFLSFIIRERIYSYFVRIILSFAFYVKQDRNIITGSNVAEIKIQ